MARSFNTFIGVDLGGGKGKNTAVALLRCNGGKARVVFVGTRSPSGVPFHDRELLSFIRQNGEGAVVAIDAPLSSTVCLRCRAPRCPGLDECVDPVVKWFREKGDPLIASERSTGKPVTTPYTQRACEVILQRQHGIMPREALGQGMGPLTARSHYLVRALEQDYRLGQQLIEVSPKATIHRLFGAEKAKNYKRQVNTWRTRAGILEALADQLSFEIWREGCLRNDHCFDAVICAYTAYLWATEEWAMPAEDTAIFEEDGWIWIPPAPPEEAEDEDEDEDAY